MKLHWPTEVPHNYKNRKRNPDSGTACGQSEGMNIQITNKKSDVTCRKCRKWLLLPNLTDTGMDR